MKKVLISFGSNGYEAAIQRLCKSATPYFDKIIAYGETDVDREFYISHLRTFQHWRGWGYWLWKPYFIEKTLKSLNDNDYCFYCDATAVFQSSPEKLFEACQQEKGILLFDNAHYRNYSWTKMDCFNLMGLNSEPYYKGKQCEAGIQLYQKNQSNLSFLQEFLFYACNYHIISDAPNITGPDLPGFIDHRHDQSILSLLAIKYQVRLAASPRREQPSPEGNIARIIDLKRDVHRQKAFYRAIFHMEAE